MSRATATVAGGPKSSAASAAFPLFTICQAPTIYHAKPNNDADKAKQIFNEISILKKNQNMHALHCNDCWSACCNLKHLTLAMSY